MKVGSVRHPSARCEGRVAGGLSVRARLLVLLALASAGSGLASECERPQDWPSLLQRFSDTVARHDWGALLQLGDETIQACPSSPRGHYWQGVARFNSGRFFAAVRSLRTSLQIEPNGRTHLALAQAYSELDQKRFAREEFEQAKSMQPTDPSVYFVEGKYFYQKESRIDLAERAIRRALELRPDHVPSLCYLALCLSAGERKAEAEGALLQAIAIARARGSADLLVHELLAELYIEMQQAEKAYSQASRAVEINPGSTKAQFLLGKAAWMLKRSERAIGAFERAIHLDDSYPEPRYLLGQVLLSTGQRRRARQELASFRELERLYGRAR